MRLAEFIQQDMEAILAEWEAFAATLLPAAEGMASLALRDHAQAILEAIAKDLATPQTREAQSEKSKGRAPKVPGAPETAAQTHAVLRAKSGLNTILMTASYLAALNAGELVSVSAARLIRSGEAMQALLDDLVDFNRTKLGLGLNVVPSDIDLAAVVSDELEQLRGAYPNRQIELRATGDNRGR
jgi:signal transduction histidine kinase